MLGPTGHQTRHQEERAESVRRENSHGPGQPGPRRRFVKSRRMYRGLNGFRARKNPSARLGELPPGLAAIEQPCAGVFFKPSDLAGNRRVVDAEPLGRLGDPAGPAELEQNAHVVSGTHGLASCCAFLQLYVRFYSLTWTLLLIQAG